jgi:hypothetical protein
VAPPAAGELTTFLAIGSALASTGPTIGETGACRPADLARAPIAAAMVCKTIGNAMINHQIPVYVERFGTSANEVFVTATELRHKLGNEEFERIPAGAIGLYTYYERLAQGLRQLMAGCRKFSPEYVSRNYLSSITH